MKFLNFSCDLTIHPPIVVALEVIDTKEGTIDNTSSRPQVGMVFEVFPGTTVDTLVAVTRSKGELPVIFPRREAVLYDTGRAWWFSLNCGPNHGVLTTNHTTYKVHTKPAPRPHWLKRKLYRLQLLVFGQSKGQQVA